MSKVFKTATHYIYGYRDANGRDWLEEDQPGEWFGIEANEEFGIPALHFVTYSYIRESLDARGHSDWPVLMRKVETTYYEAEEVG